MVITVGGYRPATAEGLNNKLGLNKVLGAKQLSLEKSCIRGEKAEKMEEHRCHVKSNRVGHLTKH